MYLPKTKPYRHQSDARVAALGRAAFAFFMEMGTGKTKVVIDEICEMFTKGECDLAIVYAPKGVYTNWANRELPVHLWDDVAERCDVLTWNEPGPGYAKKLASFLVPKPGRLRLFFVNIEAFSNSVKADKYVRALLATSSRRYGAVDESTFIKTHDSNRTETIVKHGRLYETRRIMTGSPVTRSPLDLYSQFEFLGPRLLGFGSFYSYRARYAVMEEKFFGGRRAKIVVGYRDVESLNELIAPHMFRVLKDDCLDLPPKVYVTREVEMTDEQRRLYGEVLRSATTQLGQKVDCEQCGGSGKISEDDQEYDCGLCAGAGFSRDGTHVTATEVIVQILRLHQILCGHATDETGQIHSVASNRVKTMMEVIAETSEKVIIWSRYRADIRDIVTALENEYGPNSVAQYHGGTSAADREISSRRFQEDPTCRFMVSNAQTGGYGNTWTAAGVVIYYSNDYDLEKRLQSEDRPHRAGQTKSVLYVDLMCVGTVEEKIVKALRAKINISTAIMGDGYRSWLV